MSAGMSKHTPGPWRWEINRTSKSIHLVGGRPRFDKTVMEFERWGMSRAAPRFNAEITGDQYNIMTRVPDRPDWIAPFTGRDHHADWCAAITHPDAVLIESAPDLLAMLVEAHDIIDAIGQPETAEVAARMRATIAKARGEA